MSARRSFRRWIAARKMVQIAALLIVIALLIMTRRGGWPPEIVNLIMRLDPLAVLAQALASRSFLLGSMVVLLTVLLTVIAGRAWCGWLCPLGTVLDLIPLRKRTLRDKQPNLPHSWRSIKYGLLIAILVAALFGNLTLLIFDPLTIFIRTFTTALWPATDQIVTAIETALYRVSVLSDPISSIDRLAAPGDLTESTGILSRGVVVRRGVRRHHRAESDRAAFLVSLSVPVRRSAGLDQPWGTAAP